MTNTPSVTERRYLTSSHNALQCDEPGPAYTVENQFGHHWGILNYSKAEQVVAVIMELNQYERYNLTMLQPITWLKEISYCKETRQAAVHALFFFFFFLVLRAITHETDEMKCLHWRWFVIKMLSAFFWHETRNTPRLCYTGTTWEWITSCFTMFDSGCQKAYTYSINRSGCSNARFCKTNPGCHPRHWEWHISG